METMKHKNQIVLSISHHIYLTAEERYALHDRKEIETTGVSLPVWFYRGTTSEPGAEVFCKYILKNEKAESTISNIVGGYEINLPQLPKGYKKPKLSDKEWRKMSFEEREKWYSENEAPLSSKNLLNYKDGGGKHLGWQEHNKLIKHGKTLSIVNFVQIDDISDLTESLTF
jgi:hypothetical protein